MKYAPSINKKTWKIAQQLNFKAYFISKDSPAIIDDHYYVNTLANIPMINIVDYDPANKESFFPSYHHTSNDDMKIIDKKTLQAVAQTLVQVLYNESAELQ
jgi:aminopeptidase-like protein